MDVVGHLVSKTISMHCASFGMEKDEIREYPMRLYWMAAVGIIIRPMFPRGGVLV